MSTLDELRATVPQVGRVRTILLRTARRGEMRTVDTAEALVGQGLAGDRRAARDPDPAARRQVTLIQAEHLDVLAGLLDRPSVDPALLRRNWSCPA